jgi:hypothetical protein
VVSSIFYSLEIFDIFRVLDTPRVVIPKKPVASAKSVRLLSYNKVPKMEVTSRLFQKAEAMVAKQAASTPRASGSSSPTSKMSLERLSGLQQGMSYFSFSSSHC